MIQRCERTPEVTLRRVRFSPDAAACVEPEVTVTGYDVLDPGAEILVHVEFNTPMQTDHDGSWECFLEDDLYSFSGATWIDSTHLDLTFSFVTPVPGEGTYLRYSGFSGPEDPARIATALPCDLPLPEGGQNYPFEP